MKVKKCFFPLCIILFFALFVRTMRPAYAQSSTGSVVTIENAQRTEYKKDKESGDDLIVLTGSVLISVERGSTKTTITAANVTYNRRTDMLFAQGSVTLKQTSSSSGEQNITAESLLFNTSTLEGVFDNGRAIQTQSDAINLPSGSTLIVASNIFGRDSSGTVTFKNGELTFCDAPDPHWKIRATKIWLLPGGEFAFFNALLYVGHVPLLYLPAFYYPKDELIFNPVFGYSRRTGYYFQTTAYLYGRKPLNMASSSSAEGSGGAEEVGEGLYNFMRPTKLKEQRREGLILHNLDEDFVGNTSNYIKVMGDWYSNLGGMVGVAGVIKPKYIFSELEASLNLGFSNTLFGDAGTGYSVFSSRGETYQDRSNFLGLDMPFRYRANLKLAVTKPFSINLSMPVYSDPFFDYDFGFVSGTTQRREDMDWISFLMKGADDSSSEDDSSTATEISSFNWALNGSYTISVPDFFKPYITSLSISGLSSSIVFSSKTNSNLTSTDNWASYTPERKFYYPSQITPFKISTRIAGTLLQIPGSVLSEKKTPSFPVPLSMPDELLVEAESADAVQNASMTEQDVLEPEEGAPDKGREKTAESESEPGTDVAQHDGEVLEQEDLSQLSEADLPLLSVSSAAEALSFPGMAYSLSYSITPEYTSQLSYDSSKIMEPSDFEWNDVQSTYFQVKVPTTLTSKISYRDSFLSMSNGFTFNPVYQDHPNLDGYTDTSAISIKTADYNARKLDLTNTNTVAFRPFLYSKYFKDTGLNWNTTVKMVRTNFLGDAENPEWEYLTMDLTDEDCVTDHTLSADFAATEGNFSQKLTLSTTLPPQVDRYTGTLTFGFPFVTLTCSSGIEKKSKTDESWKKNPFQQSLSVRLFSTSSNALTFSQSFNYNLEDGYSDSLKFALSWQGLQLAYTMQYTYGYDFANTTGWTVRSDKEFLPVTASIAYTSTSKTYRYWKRRVAWAPLLSTSLVYDCLRPTNSYFSFIPAVTFKINEFLELTFSSESRNNIIYRYIQKYTDFEGTISGETNIFIDLFNSFAFWDEDKRKNSGFKLKNLNVTITHSLCDWDLKASFSVKPRLVSGAYDFEPYFTLSVVWKPMGSMKTEIVDDYGTWKLNP